MDPITPCKYLGCPADATSTVLAGATRVPACDRHAGEWAGRYPDEAHLVHPLRMAYEAPGRVSRVAGGSRVA